jgi:hypothetical protein
MANDDWFSSAAGSEWDSAQWTTATSPTPPTPEPGSALSWWKSRPAIGTAAGLVGLIMGLSVSDTGGDTHALNQRISALSAQRGDLQDQVKKLKNDSSSQQTTDEAVAAAVAAVKADAAAAQKTAVAKAIARERQRTDRLVAEARAAAAAADPRSATPGDGGSDGGVDPRFATCGEANDNGYGPYASGTDPEYDWYQDRDHDGVVCEP